MTTQRYVTSKEGKIKALPVLNYLQIYDTDGSMFYNILNLDNTIDRVNACGYIKKKKITDF